MTAETQQTHIEVARERTFYYFVGLKRPRIIEINLDFLAINENMIFFYNLYHCASICGYCVLFEKCK